MLSLSVSSTLINIQYIHKIKYQDDINIKILKTKISKAHCTIC